MSKQVKICISLSLIGLVLAAGVLLYKKREQEKRIFKYAHEIKGVPGFKVEDVKVGKGQIAVSGKTLEVRYEGRLTDDTLFSSNREKKPFRFHLGYGHVIQGWDKGLAGMRVGGVRRLIIPPEMGYGERSIGKVIPPNSTLIFEIELLSVAD